MKGSKPKMRDRSMSVGFGAEDIKEIAKLELKKNGIKFKIHDQHLYRIRENGMHYFQFHVFDFAQGT